MTKPSVNTGFYDQIVDLLLAARKMWFVPLIKLWCSLTLRLGE